MTLAVDFDGSGGSVSLPSIDVDGSNGWSVQAWVRMREVGNWARVLELSNGAGQGNLFLSAVGSTRAFGLHQWVDGGVQGALHGATLRPNEWVHLSGPISASGKTALSSRMNSRRLTVAASVSRLRQTRTMLEASAFESAPRIRLLSSVRMGQVPVREKPARITASRNVSHPVLWVPDSSSVSACLNA